MKKLIVFIVVVAALIGGVVLAVPYLLPIEKVQAEAKAKFKETTGRDLEFGQMRFMFWPNIGLQLSDVTVSNPAWAKEKSMLTLGTMDVRLALQPLLEKRVEVKRFVLEKPVIHLETTADGKTSWAFAAAEKAAEENSEGSSGGNAMQEFAIKLGEFQFSDGLVTFRDGKTGQTHEVSDIDMAVMLPDLDSAMQIDGALTYRGKRVTLVASVEKPMALLGGDKSAGSASVKTDDFAAKVTGAFATAGTMLKGDIDTTISSLPGLLAWTGDGQAKEPPFKTVAFKSGAELTADKLSLSGASLSLDDINAGGDASMTFGGKPSVYARLAMDRIDLDRFTGSKSGGGGTGGGKPGPQEKWDATPIDFSALNAVDADLILQTKGFSLKGAEVGPSNLTVLLKGGKLDFKSSEATLFEGKFTSDLTVNAAGPSMAFNFKMDGVQAKPVLTTFADFDKLSGAADANVSVTSAGGSQKAIVENLAGSGGVTFRNGSLQGIDLVNIAKMIQSKLANMEIGDGKTDFVELGGAFTVKNGVASNNDLKMKGPLVQATGSGDIDLPKKYVQYRVLPVLTASSAVDNAKGITVPVDIKGPFNNIKIKPDYASVIKNALENPEEMKQTLKNVEDNLEPLKDNLKNIKKDLKKDPAKAIESLLGTGLLGPKPQPAPAPAPEPAPVPEAAPAPAEGQ